MRIAVGKEQLLFLAFQYLIELCFCLADILNQFFVL